MRRVLSIAGDVLLYLGALAVAAFFVVVVVMSNARGGVAGVGGIYVWLFALHAAAALLVLAIVALTTFLAVDYVRDRRRRA